MFRPLILEPVVMQITLVISVLLIISVWQKLKVASGVVLAVYTIYMFSFVSVTAVTASQCFDTRCSSLYCTCENC